MDNESEIIVTKSNPTLLQNDFYLSIFREGDESRNCAHSNSFHAGAGVWLIAFFVSFNPTVHCFVHLQLRDLPSEIFQGK